MVVHRCDNCKKLIEDHKGLNLSRGFAHLDVCEACAMPIMETIGRQKLLALKLIKKLQADPYGALK